jgi:catechol 2,3-dioxygenase-like lactoylglutathione lyase family enzyme
MAVRRIVANFYAADPTEAAVFYANFLGLELVMDLGWITTFAGTGPTRPQVSIAQQGGSDTPVPALSVEVDDVDEIHARAISFGLEIVYALVDEPWGVRRFYVRDPFGNIINILGHWS